MRISDWSSDVCSSDLARAGHSAANGCASFRHRWGYQGKARNLGIERFAAGPKHMIAALHRSRRGRQGAARHIIISAAGFDHRLLAHHAFTFDTMLRAAAISNGPATGQQLHRFRSTIFDANMICPEPASSVRRSEEHTSELQSLMRISYA